MPIRTIVFLSGRCQLKRLASYPKDQIIFFPLDFTSSYELLKEKIPYKAFNVILDESVVNSQIKHYFNKLISEIHYSYGENSKEAQYLTIIKETLAKTLLTLLSTQSTVDKILNDYKDSEVILSCPNNPKYLNTLERIIIATTRVKSQKLHLLKVSTLTLFKEKVIDFLVKSQFNFSDFLLTLLRGYLPFLFRILQRIHYYFYKHKKIIFKNGDKKRILVLPGVYATYLGKLLPLVKELNQMYHIIPVIFDDLFNKMSWPLRKNKIAFNNYASYLDKEAEKEINRLKKYCENAKKNILGILKNNLQGHLPISWEILSNSLEKMLIKSVFRNIPFLKIATLKVINQEKPNLIILPDDTSIISRIALLEAKKENIKALITPTKSKLLLEEEPLWDTKLIIGNYQLSKISYDSPVIEKIIAVGNPYFDNLLKRKPLMKKEEICQRIKVPEGKKILLFTLQAFRDNDGLIKILCKVMQRLPDCHLVIRPHPTQSDIVYKYIVKKFKIKNITVSKLFDSYDIINIVDLVISISSATIFEAVLLNKPIIVLGSPSAELPIQDNRVEFIDNIAKLYEKAKEMILESDKKEKLYDNRLKLIFELVPPGQSMLKIVKIVNRLLNINSL
ncbi:MAG: UDP-N-acetylglucosamine 2-epimerase [Candidatus Omnitrophica bacterium]|jgi:hypothetical protein|nr:UDP-N-acetylglucosamine 2-epimerase [Candidatus Omnitrophota bacterium]